MVANERGRAGHPDESIKAAGVRKKMLTDLLQGNMTPAEKGHVLHVAQGNWSVTKKIRSERMWPFTTKRRSDSDMQKRQNARPE